MALPSTSATIVLGVATMLCLAPVPVSGKTAPKRLKPAASYPYLKPQRVSQPVRPVRYPKPVLPFEAVTPEPEPYPTESLADAIALAYRTNPTLGVRRYELRATDEGLAQALAQLRPTTQVQISGSYDKTVPGRVTQANRPLQDRLRSSVITHNDVSAQFIVDQPLYTGGRASADIASANADIRAGREALRVTEGDLLVQVISAYVDVRRDTRGVVIRKNNVAVLERTLEEVSARREAGELTRTDIAQAQNQLQSARVQLNAAQAQLEQSRAAYAAFVGQNPGVLAAEPPLPLLPGSIDDAFDAAERSNPELAQAVFAERGSRARIAAARAAGHPTLALRGTATLAGPSAQSGPTSPNGSSFPFRLANEDKSFAARATLTVPLTQGGRVGSQVGQALDRNSADRLRIEAARRQMVQNIVSAWNQIVTSERNLGAQKAQLEAARIYYEGTFEEYRAGLRSTFDVLFAQNALRETEIALAGSRRDLYVAKATLLRQIGRLEVGKLLTGTGLYDPSVHVRQVEKRGRLPWDNGIRALDRVDAPNQRQQPIDQPERRPETPQMAPAESAPSNSPLISKSPITPAPGTVGRPIVRKKP